MATRQFSIRTEPHIAQVGDTELRFVPEVMGTEFLDEYERLRETQKRAGVGLDEADPDELRRVTAALRRFLARFMLPESQEVFSRFAVVEGGKEVAAYVTREEAEEHAAGLNARPGIKGVTVRDDSMLLPDRILVAMLEWTAELYGSGSGAEGRPTGPSSASASRSPKAGRRGTATSRSKA